MAPSFVRPTIAVPNAATAARVAVGAVAAHPRTGIERVRFVLFGERLLATAAVGDEVALDLVRPDGRRTATVTLAEAP